MAYAFERIESAFANPQKQNIFGADEGQVAGNGQQPGMPAIAQQKTSLEGSIAGAGGGANGGPSSTGDQIDGVDGGREAVKKAAGKTQNPALITKAQEGLSAADAELQKDANEYIANAGKTTYAPDQATLTSAIDGNEEAMGQVVSTLSRQQADPIQGFESDADIVQANVDRLQTDAGIKRALRDEGGAEYTEGMSAFDLMALHRTPEFEKIIAELKKGKEDLVKKAGDLGKTKTEEAQTIANNRLTEAKGSIEEYFSKTANGIREAARAKAKAAEDEARAKAAEEAARNSEEILRALTEEAPDEARLDELLLNAGIDPSQFYSVNSANYGDYVDETDAAKFNRIMAALGKNDPDSVLPRSAGSPLASFDAESYKDAVIQAATGKRAEEDARLQAELDKLLGGASSRLGAADSVRSMESSTVKGDLSQAYGDLYSRSIADILRQEYGDLYDQYMAETLQGQLGDLLGATGAGVNEAAYNRDLRVDDTLTAADIAELNKLYGALGKSNPYAKEGAGLNAAFDDAAYRKDATASLEARKEALARAREDARRIREGSKRSAEQERRGLKDEVDAVGRTIDRAIGNPVKNLKRNLGF